MPTFAERAQQVDVKVTRFMADHGIFFLRISVGIVFLWFGFLKFIPNMSPAEDLAIRTTRVLTFGVVPDTVAIIVLAAWESLIGLLLLLRRFLRLTIFLLLLQMVGAIAPIFLFPSEVFLRIPYAPTLEGQYIIKNMVLISAALVIGATVRGGGLVSDPETCEEEIEESLT
jgi:uncharacterized membrane protein YphA (DoxX/SURF4 family)